MEEHQTKDQVQDTQVQEQAQPEAEPKQQDTGGYILKHNRPDCIGCAACEAVAPDFWEMNADSKSDIKGGKNVDNGWQELEFKEKDLQINKDGADSCPVNVIHIVKKETGEKLI